MKDLIHELLGSEDDFRKIFPEPSILNAVRTGVINFYEQASNKVVIRDDVMRMKLKKRDETMGLQGLKEYIYRCFLEEVMLLYSY